MTELTRQQDAFAEQVAAEYGRSAVERWIGENDPIVIAMIDDVELAAWRVAPDGTPTPVCPHRDRP